MAIITLNNNSLSNISSLPAGVGGKVLQVVQSTSTTLASTTGTSFIDTSLSGTITPSSSSNKILISCTQIIQTYRSSGNYAAGRWKIVQTIGATSTDINTGGDSGSGNVFAYDYGNSGINFFRPTNITKLISPSTTSEITYKTQIAKGTDGGDAIYCYDDKDAGIMVLLEVEA